MLAKKGQLEASATTDLGDEDDFFVRDKKYNTVDEQHPIPSFGISSTSGASGEPAFVHQRDHETSLTNEGSLNV